MLDAADRDGIHGMHGNAVIVDPADLLGLAEYLESITSTVCWEGKTVCGAIFWIPHGTGRVCRDGETERWRLS